MNHHSAARFKFSVELKLSAMLLMVENYSLLLTVLQVLQQTWKYKLQDGNIFGYSTVLHCKSCTESTEPASQYHMAVAGTCESD